MGKRKRASAQPSAIEAQYAHACMLLLACQYCYYHHGHEILTDSEYDMLNAHLSRFEAENTAMKHPKSPTFSIGSDLKSSYPPSVVAWVDSRVDEAGAAPAVDRAAWSNLILGLPVVDRAASTAFAYDAAVAKSRSSDDLGEAL